MRSGPFFALTEICLFIYFSVKKVYTYLRTLTFEPLPLRLRERRDGGASGPGREQTEGPKVRVEVTDDWYTGPLVRERRLSGGEGVDL